VIAEREGNLKGFFSLNFKVGGAWVAQMVKHLPLAQVMIPGSWDGAPAWGSLLGGEPASPSTVPPACALSLYQINK